MRKLTLIMAGIIAIALLSGCGKKGCIDRKAINFNSKAARDDGSCRYLLGCTDPEASNYNANAGKDNGSCIYTGKIVFFTKNSGGYKITVNIAGQTQEITMYYSTFDPGCHSPGCATFILGAGNHYFTATEAITGKTWNGWVTVLNNQCGGMQLNY